MYFNIEYFNIEYYTLVNDKHLEKKLKIGISEIYK
ncbi:hypothetical protein MNBD_UNCLBAC01-1030 [hydrothermal vent metagenome]|uniref:Uncharacterized protein n=1 Tax=hydrothermal vent metagenome TaxID=652676 RepID=A0A3B1DMY5_9ZZZZ